MLCIDIGASRIKAAVLPKELAADELTEVPMITMRTLGWLNQSMPEIISVENWASIVNQKVLSDQYSEIAICVPGPVRDGEFDRPDLDVPKNLLRKFKSFTDKPVRLVKDADAWTAGAVAYSRLRGDSLELPAIALAFGTGVGFSVACDSDRIMSVEISQWPWGFFSLEQASGHAVNESWIVHNILGNGFFEWVARNKRHWTYERIRSEFSQRVAALIADTAPHISDHVGRVKTVIIGGGNSEFVSLRSLQEQCNLKVKSFWCRRISVNPDIIPLIGLHRLVSSKLTTIETF